jgi:hypothetical protein
MTDWVIAVIYIMGAIIFFGFIVVLIRCLVLAFETILYRRQNFYCTRCGCSRQPKAECGSCHAAEEQIVQTRCPNENCATLVHPFEEYCPGCGDDLASYWKITMSHALERHAGFVAKSHAIVLLRGPNGAA